MHAIVITFTSELDLADLQSSMCEYADALCAVPGLVAKTWLRDGRTLGGSYVFRDAASADAYLAGPLIAGLRANSAFSGFDVRRFDVLDALTARTWGEPVLTR